jgi:chromosome segregation ATPase
MLQKHAEQLGNAAWSMTKQDPIVREVVVQLVSLAKLFEMHVVEHDHHITSIHDNMDTLDGAIIVASDDVRELQANLSRFIGIIGRLSNDFANVFRDIKKDVASRITDFDHRLKHLGLRLNNTEHDYRVVSRQLEALSKQVEAIQSERQLESVSPSALRSKISRLTYALTPPETSTLIACSESWRLTHLLETLLVWSRRG